MIRSLAFAAVLAPMTLASAAFAQSLAPEVPNPANPYRYNPVATNGTPLPSQAATGSPYGTRGVLRSGRSVGLDAPVVATPVDGLVGGGLGVIGSTVDGIGTVAGTVVGGTVGAIAR